MLEYLISLIAPHACLVCQQEGRIICNVCMLEAFPALPDCCYKCQKISSEGRVCATCRRSTPLEYVWARTGYEDAARRLVRKFKFERANKAAQPIGTLMAECLPYGVESLIVVPLPTATTRVRARGYDHAVLIAKVLSKERNLPCVTALQRLGATRQVGASRAKRLTQLDGAIYCSRPRSIVGKHVLLVDDVVTTGASIEQAAKVLKKAGAAKVSAIVFARKAVTFPQ